MDRSTRRPTITTVAERAGVSPMTVSRVLAGRGQVTPALAERVHAAVEALGYRRNEQARSLRPGQRSGLVGVAISNVANPYYAQFVLGAEEVLDPAGRILMIGSTADDPAREERLVADFIGRQVEALLLVPTGARAPLQPERLSGVPLVLASRQVPGIAADTVLVADVSGSYQGTAGLIADGHRRIAFLGTAMSEFTGRRRLEGFRLAHEDAGLAVDPALVALDASPSRRRDPETVLDELLTTEPELSAVFCANNRNAVAAVRTLGRLPSGERGVTLLCFDDFELAEVLGELAALPLRVIDHDARELGRQAAAMVLERLDGGYRGAARTVELPTTLRRL